AGTAAQDTEHLREQSELDETAAHGEVEGQNDQERDDQEAPEQVVEAHEQVVEDVHAFPFRWRAVPSAGIGVSRNCPRPGPAIQARTRECAVKERKTPLGKAKGPVPAPRPGRTPSMLLLSCAQRCGVESRRSPR